MGNSFCCACLGIILLAVEPAHSERIVVPFGADSVKYNLMTDPPAGGDSSEVYLPGFDDSAWPTGPAPFGIDTTGCTQNDARTAWPVDRWLVVRLWVEIPADTDTLKISIRQSCSREVWTNGRFRTNVPDFDYCEVIGGDGFFAQSFPETGQYLIVLSLRPTPSFGRTYIDFSVSISEPRVQVQTATWARVKALYRDEEDE